MTLSTIFAKLPTGISIFSFEIRYYAIFILVGAIVAYLLSRFFVRKAGYDDSILEGTFYFAFPMGIVGARIWYVIAEWGKEFANQPFYKVFAIWEGGLAIQGGVVLGFIAGIWYIHHRKPHYNALSIVDLIVPNILLAQAIGRWGNFFNAEVYGNCIDPSSISFLPDFIIEQLHYNAEGGLACDNGQVVTPLFLIEASLNVLGFFILMFGVRKGLKKWIKPGDIAAGYFIWYGAIRAILEPMRNPIYRMGQNTMISQVVSIASIVVGVIFIFINRYLDKKRQEKYKDVPSNTKAYLEYREQFQKQQESDEVEVISEIE